MDGGGGICRDKCMRRSKVRTARNCSHRLDGGEDLRSLQRLYDAEIEGGRSDATSRAAQSELLAFRNGDLRVAEYRSLPGRCVPIAHGSHHVALPSTSHDQPWTHLSSV